MNPRDADEKLVSERTLELETLLERSRLLMESCSIHPGLTRKIEALLKAYADEGQVHKSSELIAQSESDTDSAGPESSPTASLYSADPLDQAFGISSDERDGAIIAQKYTLEAKIGEGGMGSVWRARQTQPVQRYVAVKLIKAGMDSREIVSRFEAERQALALMDHPNIAKVLDGGLHKNRPFFVMELVVGVPITDYCDTHKLTPRSRLELFVQVCQAIQHAHQKGVIHRDIKPSNVLATRYDDKPMVKVIDFGVAKATSAALTDKTLLTGIGGIVGTPQYMSPEQATFDNLDIDTRSDVYALGVLLYELLTGSPPFAKKDLEQRGLMEMLRIVREVEPQRPSTKLSTADALPSISANRATEPKKLTVLLKNELDWIVMKALEKDRTRRYETANGFATDVLRYLNGEAVQAHPPSKFYRLNKFVQRNKGQVVASTFVLLALVAGLAGTMSGLIEAKRQAQLAREETSEKEKARQAEATQAEGERQAKLEADSKRQEAQASLLKEQKARAVTEAITAFMLDVFAQGSGDWQELPIRSANRKLTVKEAIDVAAKRVGSRFKDQPEVEAAIRDKFGNIYRELGAYQEALHQLEMAVKIYEKIDGPDHPETISCMHNLGLILLTLKRYDEAEVYFQRRTTKVEGGTLSQDPQKQLDVWTALDNLGRVYYAQGREKDAERLFKQALVGRELILGPEHPTSLLSAINLAIMHHDRGEYAEAETIYKRAVASGESVLGTEHSFTLTSMSNLASLYSDWCRYDEAEALYKKALAAHEKVLGSEHPKSFATENGLARLYYRWGRYPLAESHFKRTLAGREKVLGREHVDTIDTAIGLISVYFESDQKARAIELLADIRNRMPKDSSELARRLASISISLSKSGAYLESEQYLRECLAIRLRLQPEAWITFHTHALLGGSLRGQRKFTEAEQHLLQGYEGMKHRREMIPSKSLNRILEAIDELIELYTATDKPEEVNRLRSERARYTSQQKISAKHENK